MLMKETLWQETNKRVGDGGEGNATYEAEEMDAWTWGTSARHLHQYVKCT